MNLLQFVINYFLEALIRQEATFIFFLQGTLYNGSHNGFLATEEKLIHSANSHLFHNWDGRAREYKILIPYGASAN